jgi:dihydroorotase
MAFDLLLEGGRVVDPAQGIDRKLNVGVEDGTIAALLDPHEVVSAGRVVDVAGQLVMPGLVDLHTHVYWGGTPAGIQPDPVSARSGVTTFVDAGSAGAGNFEGFVEHVIRRSRCRILAFLNIYNPGLVNTSRWIPRSERNPIHFASVPAAIDVSERYSDVIVGIKIMASGEYNFSGVTALRLGIDAASRLGKPVMVHRGTPPPTATEVLRELRPGDILTHSFRGGTSSCLTADGKVMPELVAAKERGVILDIGHGLRSFSAPVAAAMLEQGVLPDVISSDLHAGNLYGPVFDLPTTMSKMLSLGMDLVDVVAATTSNPARAIGKANMTGTLSIGTRADIAVFELAEGQFKFSYGVNDGSGQSTLESFVGSKRLNHVMTVLGGEALPSADGAGHALDQNSQ